MTRARLERLEAALDRLRREAAGQLLVVEGRKDDAALEALGVGGQRVLVHQGKTLQDVADSIAEQAQGRRVIILVDWDRTGGRLHRRFRDALAGRVPLDSEHRRRIARESHERCIEDLPAELAALRRRFS